MSSRTWIAILVALLIAALTLVISRRFFGFSLLLLPLFFVWGGRRRDR